VDMPVQAKLFELPVQEAVAESQDSADSSRMDISFTLTPYPAYKDSGVEWLGKVPEHWEVRRLGAVVQILNGATPSSSRPEYWDGDIVWVTPEDLGKLKGRYIDNSSRRITQDGYNACGTTLAPAGSIVLSTRAPIGHLGILRVAACANQGCRLLVPHTVTTSDFLYHMLLAARPSLEVLGQGSTFLELSRSKLGMFPIPLPPLPEQTAIVRFLEYIDRRIRRVVHARQRQIKLLEEYRQALIHQTVTGQIDVRTGKPYPAYKDSGVEWLGKVPEHWETISLKRVARIRSGDAIPTDKVQSVKMETACIQVIGGNGLLGFTQTANTTGGVIVIGRVGALCGNVHEIREPVWVTDNALVLWLRREAFALTYLAAVLRARNLNEIADKTAQPLITGTRVIAQIVPLPPLPEQTAIVEYLDAQTAKIDAATSALRREIELLREYRERLIADVVTGKVDVRKVVEQLPEEPPHESELTEIEAPEGNDDEPIASSDVSWQPE